MDGWVFKSHNFAQRESNIVRTLLFFFHTTFLLHSLSMCVRSNALLDETIAQQYIFNTICIMEHHPATTTTTTTTTQKVTTITQSLPKDISYHENARHLIVTQAFSFPFLSLIHSFTSTSSGCCCFSLVLVFFSSSSLFSSLFAFYSVGFSPLMRFTAHCFQSFHTANFGFVAREISVFFVYVTLM